MKTNNTTSENRENFQPVFINGKYLIVFEDNKCYLAVVKIRLGNNKNLFISPIMLRTRLSISVNENNFRGHF